MSCSVIASRELRKAIAEQAWLLDMYESMCQMMGLDKRHTTTAQRSRSAFPDCKNDATSGSLWLHRLRRARLARLSLCMSGRKLAHSHPPHQARCLQFSIHTMQTMQHAPPPVHPESLPKAPSTTYVLRPGSPAVLLCPVWSGPSK